MDQFTMQRRAEVLKLAKAIALIKPADSYAIGISMKIPECVVCSWLSESQEFKAFAAPGASSTKFRLIKGGK